jgi:hypothetical protein
MDYKQKYLKYKEKYLRLKAELEGGKIEAEFLNPGDYVTDTYFTGEKDEFKQKKKIYYIIYEEDNGTNKHFFDAIRAGLPTSFEHLVLMNDIFTDKLKVLKAALSKKTKPNLTNDIQIRIGGKDKEGKMRTQSITEIFDIHNDPLEISNYRFDKDGKLKYIILGRRKFGDTKPRSK